MHVLVMCYANRWRSPLAAHCLAAEGLTVQSAGFAREGLRVGSSVRVAAARMGFDLGEHRSQRVTQTLVDWADAIVLMNDSHFRRMTSSFQYLPRLRWYKLGEFATPPVKSIPDLGFLQGKKFDDTVTLIQRAAQELSKELKRYAK